MDPTNEFPAYVSKVTPLPAAIAPKLFDHWSWVVTEGDGAGASIAVAVPDGQLVVHGSSLQRYASPGLAYPYRRLQGRLEFRHLLTRDVDVEIELAPWSKTRSELAIRPAGNREPWVWSRRRYHALAAEVLDGLSKSLADQRTDDQELDGTVSVAA